eukprot:13501661-Ditylum_brightwellii.AAC.1
MVASGSDVDFTGSIWLKSPKANTGVPPKFFSSPVTCFNLASKQPFFPACFMGQSQAFPGTFLFLPLPIERSEHKVDPLILIAVTLIQAILTVVVPSNSAISEMALTA